MVLRRVFGGSGGQLRYRLNTTLAADLVEFSQKQYDSLDYDSFHPLLVHLGKGLDREDHLWLCTLFMAFYNIGSAWVAFKNSDRLKPLPEWMGRLPVGVQRRNLRGGKVLPHLESFSALATQQGGIEGHLTAGFEASGEFERNWGLLKENVGKPWGNGRWSVYTTSELYQKVNKLPVLPMEIGNQGSTGPRSGLARFFGIAEPKEESVEKLDQLADKLFEHVRSRINTQIFYLPNGHYDMAMLESQLCDFNSMVKGRYYVGRDIDRDQNRIYEAEKTLKGLGQKVSLAEVWEAREAVFDGRYLGEVSGWGGMTEYAKMHYKRTGKIADHMTIREEIRAGHFF